MALNKVVGDRPFVDRYGRPPSGADSDVSRIQAHLKYVTDALRDQPGIDGAIITTLESYCRAGKFPSTFDRGKVKQDFPRGPCFIDDDGTHCALGHLIKETGEAELAQRINAAHRFHYVDEIVAEADVGTLNALVAWGDLHGLDSGHFAMIQPTYGYDRYGRMAMVRRRDVPPCDNCYASVVDVRFKCTVCENYFLCEECMEAGVHVDENHEFERIEPPDDHDEDGEL